MLDHLIHILLVALLLAYVWLFLTLNAQNPLLPLLASELQYQLGLLLGSWTPVQRTMGGAVLLSVGTALLFRGAELRHAQ